MIRKRYGRYVVEVYDAAKKGKRDVGTYATRREARDAEVDALVKGRHHGTSRETCDQFAGRWTRDYPRPRASTNAHNSERVKAFARDFVAVRLGDITRPQARAWILQHRGSLAAVRAMFTDAVADGLLETNPFANLRLPGSRGRKDLVALTETDLHAFADVALDARMELHDYAPAYRAMILFAGYTGVRPGELFALRRSDVSGDHVRVERSLSSKTRQEGPTKNGRARDIVLPPAARDALADVREDRSGLLFTSPTGKQWTQQLHNRYWTRLRLVANRPGMAFYELRHCAATMLLERGMTPWDVAVQLGHTDGGGLVMDRYGHPSEAGARSRLLAAWDQAGGPRPITQIREQRRTG